jgi:Rrf2 family protein
MIKLNKEVDMGIVILGYLFESGEKVSASEIARTLKLPRPWVRKVLKRMAKARLVQSFPGRVGGYQMAPRTKNVPLVAIVELFQGPIALTVCSGPKGACLNARRCSSLPAIRELNRKILDAFASVKVGRILENA